MSNPFGWGRCSTGAWFGAGWNCGEGKRGLLVNATVVAAALEGLGLARLGWFRPGNDDGVPPAGPGQPARTVVLVGNAGPQMWRRFSAERPAGPHPLDQWSEAVLTAVAERLGAKAVFPFQRPYLPFQRWAVSAGCGQASPLGILIHPRYGLWHGYRGALLFPIDLAFDGEPAVPSEHPCLSCISRPCLSSCPVEAFGAGYDVPRCVAQLGRPAGRDCMELGCRARRACPVGCAYRYDPAQAAFHMTAFFNNHRH
jgi:hypothetical protein